MSTGKGRIRPSTKNGGIRVSFGKVGFWLVPKIGNPGEYRKYEIRGSIGNVGSGRVPKMGNPGKMLENPKQAKRSKQTQGKGVGPSMTSKVC